MLRIGVIGCGVISGIYLKNLTARLQGAKVVACADLDKERSRQRAEEYGLAQMTVSELLASPEIDIVFNLTIPASHAPISMAALEHGKHVYSEKPLATNLGDARRLLELAAEKGLYVGCAPDTFLGAGLQTTMKAISDGWIGKPLSAVAFFSCRGHELWHVNPDFYYQPGGGPHLDMGPYYLTALTAALGGVERVSAMGSRAFPTRTIQAGPRTGEEIPVDVDTHISAVLEFRCGVVANLMLSFDVWATNLPKLEIYGTSGSLALPDPDYFDGPVLLRSAGSQEFQELPLLYPHRENLRGLGLARMCRAIEEGTAHPASGELALHVLEVALALERSAATGESVRCTTPCSQPELLAPADQVSDYF